MPSEKLERQLEDVKRDAEVLLELFGECERDG